MKWYLVGLHFCFLRGNIFSNGCWPFFPLFSGMIVYFCVGLFFFLIKRSSVYVLNILCWLVSQMSSPILWLLFLCVFVFLYIVLVKVKNFNLIEFIPIFLLRFILCVFRNPSLLQGSKDTLTCSFMLPFKFFAWNWLLFFLFYATVFFSLKFYCLVFACFLRLKCVNLLDALK